MPNSAMTASLLDLPNSLPADEQRLLLEGVTWQQYDALVTLFHEPVSSPADDLPGGHPRTYDHLPRA
jgi:hypothetical protein